MQVVAEMVLLLIPGFLFTVYGLVRNEPRWRNVGLALLLLFALLLVVGMQVGSTAVRLH